MVLSYTEELELEKFKHEHKKEMAELDHKNKMEELEKELEIAKINIFKKGD